MDTATIAGLIGLLTAIILAIKSFVEKRKPSEPEDPVENYNEAIVSEDKDFVNIAHVDHDKRLRIIVQRWKILKSRGDKQ